MFRFKPSRITLVGILSNSIHLSALNSYPETGLYREATSYKYMYVVGEHLFVTRGLFFSGRCSATIFLTDLDGTVTQHDGNVLAVDGFPFFDGNVFGGRR